MKKYKYYEMKEFCTEVANFAAYGHVNSVSDLDVEVAHWEEFRAVVEQFPETKEWWNIKDVRVAIYDGDVLVTARGVGGCHEIDPWKILTKLDRYISEREKGEYGYLWD